ncbi:MAG: FecR domain-containing protein [Niabella sp.]
MDKIRLTYLLERYGKNVATQDEMNELQQFLSESHNEGLFSETVASLMREYADETFDKTPYSGLSRHVLQIDRGAVHTLPKARLHHIRRYIAWAAASVIILFGMSIYFYTSETKNNTAGILNKTYNIEAPGNNLAIITLADGSEVHLEKEKNGVITQLGNANLIKLANGQISYEVIDKSTAYKPQYHTVTNPRGSKPVSIRLSDGSTVWLNAGSSVTYPVIFKKNERNVELSGEGYFDVVKAPSLPFIVKTAAFDIKVLGTAFNVRAYTNESNSQTTLLRGSVEVIIKNKKRNKVILVPNEKVVVQNNASTSDKSPVLKSNTGYKLLNVAINKKDSIVAETEWTKNRLAFKQEKFEDIIPVLERWYNVKIEVRQSVSASRLYNGTFENDSLKDVLESLKIVIGFNYTIEKDKLIIF